MAETRTRAGKFGSVEVEGQAIACSEANAEESGDDIDGVTFDSEGLGEGTVK